MLIAAAASAAGRSGRRTRNGGRHDPAQGVGQVRHLWRGRGRAPPRWTSRQRRSSRTRAHWKLLGKPQKRVDMLAKVTGAPIFGVDVALPDMLFGTVKLSPRFWAKPVKRRPLKSREICRVSSRSCRSRRPTATGSASSRKTPGPRSGPRRRSKSNGARLNIRRTAPPSPRRSPMRCRLPMVRPCATMAMSMLPSPMRRAKGSSRPTMRFPIWHMRPWSR